MSDDAARLELAAGWWRRAVESLRTADLIVEHFPSAAVSHAYYACFYAASAVLAAEGRHFVKHTGVRAAVHAHLVKPGRVTVEIGRAYDELVKARQTADYGALVRVTHDEGRGAIVSARLVVSALEALLPPGVDRSTATSG